MYHGALGHVLKAEDVGAGGGMADTNRPSQAADTPSLPEAMGENSMAWTALACERRDLPARPMRSGSQAAAGGGPEGGCPVGPSVAGPEARMLQPSAPAVGRHSCAGQAG